MAVVVCIPGAADSERAFRDVTPLWPDGLTPIFHNLDLAGLTGEIRRETYSWQAEVDDLHSRVGKIGDQELYILGISGGATLALAYTAAYQHRVAGVGLFEPAWSFLPMSEVEQSYYAELDRVLQLPPNRQRDAFVRLLVQPEVRLPPVTATAALGYRQAQRAEDTALAIGTRAMQAHRVVPSQLGAFSGAVYLAVGGRSNLMWQAQVKQIKAALPQTVVEVYPERHHLDGPHHAEAPHLVNALLRAWKIV
jgi:pimeloyl-ACP methyl ester carboxylesterase